MPSPIIALDLIKTAMRYGGVIATGETPSAAETQDGLQALNDVLERFSLDQMAVYGSASVAFNTVAGTAVYTMGPGGTWGAARPTDIIEAFCTFGGVDFPLQQITQIEYNEIALKTIRTPIVQQFAYVNAFPQGLVYLYPTPSQAVAVTLSLNTPLAQVASSATLLALPTGYMRALAWAVWLELAPQYGITPTQFHVSRAVEAYAGIKRSNRVPQIAKFDPSLTSSDGFTIRFLG